MIEKTRVDSYDAAIAKRNSGNPTEGARVPAVDCIPSICPVLAMVFAILLASVAGAQAAREGKPPELAKSEADGVAGNALMTQGKYVEALSLLEGALPVALRHEQTNPRVRKLVGQVSLDIGWCKRRLLEIHPPDDLAVARERRLEVEKWLLDAYDWMLRADEPDVRAHKGADFARILGEYFMELGHHDVGTDWFGRSLERENDRPRLHKARHGMASLRYGNALIERGRWNDAVTVLESAASSLRELPPNVNYGDALAALGIAYYELGRTSAAQSAYESWLVVRDPELSPAELVEPPPPGGLPGYYWDLGEHARDTLQAGIYASSARIAIEFGDPLGAEEFLRHVEALDVGHSRHGNGQIDLTVAECLEALGRRTEAIERRNIAYDAIRRSGEPIEIGYHLAGLASARQALGENEAALELVEDCFREMERAGEGASVRRAELFGRLAECVVECGQLDRALELASERLRILRALESPDARVELPALSALSAIHARRGERVEALELAESASTLADEEKVENAWRYQLAFAARLLEPGSDEGTATAQAIQLLQVCIASLEATRTDAARLDNRDRGRFLNELRDPDPYALLSVAHRRSNDHGAAAQVLEDGRARGALDLLALDFDALLGKRTRKTESLHEAFAANRALIAEQVAAIGVRELESSRAHGADMQTQVAARMALDRALDGYRRAARDRAELVGERAREQSSRPAKLESLSQLLSGRSALLTYTLGDTECTVALVFEHGREALVRPLKTPDGESVGRGQLEGLVSSLVAPLHGDGALLDGIARRGSPMRGVGHDGNATIEQTLQRAEQLFSVLVPQEVWTVIAGLDRVYVVPDGALHYVSFETLVVPQAAADSVPPKNDVPASERYWLDVGPPILYGPSASVLDKCRARAMVSSPAKKKLDVLAVGDPHYAELEGIGEFQRLPGTTKEVLEAYSVWTGDAFAEKPSNAAFIVLLGEDATEKRVFDHAPNARILHFATHHVADETPWATRSRLLLSEPKTVAPGDDGALSMVDLLERWNGRLDGAELVVLSACATGLGDNLGPEGLLALPIGFLGAGAPAVVSTLWPVHDLPASRLMIEFHRELRQKGATPLRALVQARRSLKREDPDPSHWGAFTLLGYSK